MSSSSYEAAAQVEPRVDGAASSGDDEQLEVERPASPSRLHSAVDDLDSSPRADEYATEADLQTALGEEAVGPSGDGGAAGGGRARLATDADLDDTNFDLTEDIFHPIRQLRRQRRRWRRDAECSTRCAMRQLRKWLPVLEWLPRYKPRSDLLPDLTAGIILSVVCVPQGMAYAVLAGLEPIVGLYSCLVPPVVYALVGCSPVMQVGPFALVSLLVATSLSSLVPSYAPSDYYLAAALLLAMMSGMVLILMSVLRLGFAVSFLADCVLSAFTCAAAFLILTSQWKSFLGLTSMTTGLSFLESYEYIFEHLGSTNVATLLLGIFSVALLLGLDWANARWKPRVPIPSQLVAVVVGILITYAGDLHANYSVSIVGTIPAGLPSISFPGWGGFSVNDSSTTVTHLDLLTYSNFRSFLQPACVLAIISYIVSISIAKNFAAAENAKRAAAREQARLNSEAPPSSGAISSTPTDHLPPIEIDANQELLALGLANFLGSFVSAYPAAGSLSRSALVYNANVRSSLHAVFTALVLLLVLLLLTPLLYYLPKATLAAITCTALRGLLLQVKESARLYHLRKQDFLMWTCTFIATLLFDTQVGIAVGLVTSLLMLLKQTSRPPVATLGRLPHTDLYRNIRRFPFARTFRGLLIFRFDSTLHFANKDYFRAELVKAMNRAQDLEWKRCQPTTTIDTHLNASSDDNESDLQTDSRTDSPARGSMRARLQHLGRLKVKLRERLRRVGTSTRAGLRRLLHVGGGDSHTPDLAHHDDLDSAPSSSLDSSQSFDVSLHHMESSSDPTSESTSEAASEADVDDQIYVISEALDNISEEDAEELGDELDDDEVEGGGGRRRRSGEVEEEELTTRQRRPSRRASSPLDLTDVSLVSRSSSPLPPLATSRAACRVEWIVLDCASVVDLDDAALSMLVTLPTQLGASIVPCALKAPVRDLLARTHAFETRTPNDVAASGGASVAARSQKPCLMQPFVTVHRAVKHLTRLQAQREAQAAASALPPPPTLLPTNEDDATSLADAIQAQVDAAAVRLGAVPPPPPSPPS